VKDVSVFSSSSLAQSPIPYPFQTLKQILNLIKEIIYKPMQIIFFKENQCKLLINCVSNQSLNVEPSFLTSFGVLAQLLELHFDDSSKFELT